MGATILTILSQWLEEDFLGYLQSWKENVDQREGFSKGQKNLMCLSLETLEGLHMTGSYIKANYLLVLHSVCFSLVKAFTEVTRYLLTLPGVACQYVLSETFSQDPLENYFGQVRSRGGWCDNPTAKSCLESAQSLRVQGSQAMLPVRGNSSRKRRLLQGVEDVSNIPLPKRPRQGRHKKKKIKK